VTNTRRDAAPVEGFAVASGSWRPTAWHQQGGRSRHDRAFVQATYDVAVRVRRRLVRDLRWGRVATCSTAPHGYLDRPLESRGVRPLRPTGPVHNNKSQKGPAMAEKWGISRVGKLEVEVGETLQEAIIRLQILPLPPLAWTDCFIQTVRGHGVTIIGTGIHPDKIEAVASPAEVEDVLGKIDSAIENAPPPRRLLQAIPTPSARSATGGRAAGSPRAAALWLIFPTRPWLCGRQRRTPPWWDIRGRSCIPRRVRAWLPNPDGRGDG
jgi:hypothetical protein